MSNAPGIEGSVSRLNLKNESAVNATSALSLGVGGENPATEQPQAKGDPIEIKKSGKSSARKKVIDSDEEEA
jgi:hypothetical protein